MYKRILVPLDGSEQSEAILPLLELFVTLSETEIVLLRIVEYPYGLFSMCREYPPSDPELAKTLLSKKEAICREAKSYLERVASNLGMAGIKVCVEVGEGPVVDAILATIHRLQIDLIAMSTCGQSGGTPWELGAITDRVLHDAPVPVILIRPIACSSVPDPSLGPSLTLSV